ncbi:MAG: amidohydrolase family protein [Caldisphaeraceae archaeon]|nr:amidohydrolase family protein [Caldisphaeraceae archaeon]
MEVKAGLGLIGEELEVKRKLCITIGKDGIIESIGGYNECKNYLGGEGLIVIPQPANSHVHSGDNSFPEYGISEGLHELVAYPNGLKHRLFKTLPYQKIVSGIREFYITSYLMGMGLLIDFREGGGVGCLASKEASRGLEDKLKIVTLGRPGPNFPENCDGLGISAPLDYDPDMLKVLIKQQRYSQTHVAEDMENRRKRDLELAIELGFDTLVHGTYLEEQDIVKISDKGVNLVFCPSSNLWHGLRFPPIDLAIKQGITFALGTDNAAWSLPDIYREANIALLYLRSKGLRSDEIAKILLRALFINGYKIVDMTPSTISEGNKAKLLLIDGENSGILRSLNTYSAILKRSQFGFIRYRIDGADVLDVKITKDLNLH